MTSSIKDPTVTDATPQRACSADEPVMVAWKAYQATGDYKNTRNWALHEKHVDGSLWAAFSHGFYVAMEAKPDPEGDRTAWLIEMESDCLSRGSIAWFGIHYWHPTNGFSHEIDEALQFAREQDAEAFKREFKLNGKVVEHMWPVLSRKQSGGGSR